MSLLKILEQMDQDRERYIYELEGKLKAERTRNAELTNLLMAATASNERKQLELILAGHFDGLRSKPQEEGSDVDVNSDPDRLPGT